MKSTKRSLLSTLIVGGCIAASSRLLAQNACDNADTSCNNSVSASEAAAYLSYQNTYNNACNTAYATYTNACNAEWANYYNNLLICSNYWIPGEQATTTLYGNEEAAATATYNALTNPSCAQTAQYAEVEADYAADESMALNNESAGDGQCQTGSWNILTAYVPSLWYDSDTYNKTCGTAYAVMDRNNTYEGYEVSVQYDACSTADGNCYLSMDCSQNPPDCCFDGCEEGYNNSMHGAYASYIGSVAGPYSSDVYALDMAGVTQGYNDSEASRGYTYTCDVLYMQNTYNSSVAADAYVDTVARDAALADYTEAMCDCGGTDCTAAAEATQAASDAAALTLYNNTITSLNNTLNTGLNNAATTCNNTQTADANTYASTTTSIDNSINTLFTNAGNSYNNAANAAANAEDSCERGCGGG